MGENYPLLILEDDSIGKSVADIIDGRFVITANTRDISKLKKSMEIWFRERTLEKVKERIDLYQKYFSVEPKSIKVKEQKKRWASCTYERGLLFNWRCSMAPIFVIDYIVVHEMCHMIHMNHSKEFWNLVEYIIPNYKERKKWLKENGFKMTI
jgi:predicted metal-dependent hydrolase